ncbi:hypothetical protein Syn7502_02587 [Synechococcus sp. PCC 7502]|uniref:hypothetical protein n=1 Tax=Synechococcus sp. PCC 7502 TaxID=1173263 RepID=UPI00029F8F06|nr:hypothetical protein [Synechococcus sp. PCC 7502]AFY74550.1 hypothetical protein Syn7502_02587 [Synechococcus sp. PCC 7502]
MNTETKNLVYQAENRYLTPEEIGAFEAAVKSMPRRLSLYKLLRDREIKIMQTIADQLEAQLPEVAPKILEIAIKNLILVVRYAAMAILTDDSAFLKTRLLDWLEQISPAYDLQAVYIASFKLLNQTLKKELTPEQLALLQPLINSAQSTLAVA